MLLSKVLIFSLSFLTTTALPFNYDSREATWTDPNANQAHNKADLTKNVVDVYKSHIESTDLYSQEDADNKSLMAVEMQRKLNMESERLRIRLRQELSELQERLAPSPVHRNPTVASLRERLAPLTQQLQSSLSSNTQDLCGQLRLYLQGLETAEARAGASPALYQEAFLWMSQTLDHSSSKVADVISDFHTKTDGVIEKDLKDVSASEDDGANPDFLQEVKSRLAKETSALRIEAQNRVGALKAELAALLGSTQASQAGLAASMERFCQNAALQSQVFHTRMEKLFQALEEDLEEPSASSSSLSSSSSATQPVGSLQGDFSVKLSALIQDILHSVQ